MVFIVHPSQKMKDKVSFSVKLFGKPFVFTITEQIPFKPYKVKNAECSSAVVMTVIDNRVDRRL